MNRYKLFVIANLAFGISLVALSKVVLPVCRPVGGVAMRCSASATVESVLGLALLVVAVTAAGIVSRKVYLALSAVTAVIGLLITLVPTVIVGTCPHVHMACHSVTAPVLALTGIVITLYSTVNLIYLKFSRRNG